MKRILLTSIVLIIIALTCSAMSPLIVLERDHGKTFTTPVGGFVDIALNGNPTTGYNWKLASNVAPVFKKIFGPEFKPNSERLGSGGRVVFRFKAVKKGSKEIKLSYLRAWEKNVKPVKTFRIYVNIQ